MPSFTSSFALVVCSAKLVFDAYFAFQEPAPVFTQDALWSAYHFAQALQSAQEAAPEGSCPAPAQPEVRSVSKGAAAKSVPSEEESSVNLAILFLVCTVGALIGVVACLTVNLRRRRTPEISPYASPRKHGAGAKRSRAYPDEGW